MTKDELQKKYPDDVLSKARQLLEDYATYTEETEPYATNTIEILRSAASDLPESFDDLDF